MRKNFGTQTWLYPMPVLMIGTYDESGNPDVMNAAWGGIHDTNQVAVCIDPGHKTAENLQKTGAFTVSIAVASQVAACDYLGIVSAHQEPDKVKKAGFHVQRSSFVNAPLIAELPLTLECKVRSFDPATGCTVGEIVNVSADESILTGDGSVDPEKLSPICYDPVHHTYRTIGSVAGKAFSDGNALK